VYDRAGAIEYARTCWNVVCTDGFISGPIGAREVNRATRFVHEFDPRGNSLLHEHAIEPNGNGIDWTNLDDCSHFISCCIGRPPLLPAGGLPLPQPTSDYPGQRVYGFGNVAKLKNYLIAQGFVQVIGSKTQDRSLVIQLEAGELIVYHTDVQNEGNHFAMLLEDGNTDGVPDSNDPFGIYRPKIVCHTYCRSDDPHCT
jgi:Putative amidase domain